jgi:type VI secretion system protein ImpH
MRDFIDIINAPLYPIHFRSWSKPRLFHRLAEKKDPDIILILACLMGLGEETIRDKVDGHATLMRYLGLITQHPRSAEGLRALLADRMDEPSLRVIQCVPRVAAIPEDQQCRLGETANILGDDCYLGREIDDRAGKFRVEIGPVDIDRFTRFLPGQAGFSEMKRMIEFYLDQPLAWELRLTLRARDIRTTRLGDDYWAQLGFNTWMLSKAQAGRPLTVLLQVPPPTAQRLMTH